MTLEEIKQALAEGKKVYWQDPVYQVFRSHSGLYLIHCKINNSYIGLTHMDGVTLNGKEEDFHVAVPGSPEDKWYAPPTQTN